MNGKLRVYMDDGDMIYFDTRFVVDALTGRTKRWDDFYYLPGQLFDGIKNCRNFVKQRGDLYLVSLASSLLHSLNSTYLEFMLAQMRLETYLLFKDKDARVCVKKDEIDNFDFQILNEENLYKCLEMACLENLKKFF